jgi:hypothetical protein
MSDSTIKPGRFLIRFNQCNCAMKEFCRMFGQDPTCDEIVPDYPEDATLVKGG